MSMRRGFHSVAAASIGAAVAALTQMISTVAGAAEARPDFSGMWVHPYFPGIEPPASGPGPIVNTSRRANGTPNTGEFIGDYNNPILKPAAAAIVKQHGEISASGMTYPTPSNRCWPSGVPYIFFQPGVQVLQLPHQVVLLYMRDHEFRHVRLDEPHPGKVVPSWYGDSVGHYEGDTLVIDTVGIKADRPLGMVDMFGTPFSAALHVVERYRLVDDAEARSALARNLTVNTRVPDTASDLSYKGRRLQVVYVVDDAGVFTMPWSAAITYERPAMAWPEIVCAENPFDFFAGKNGAFLPTASRPDF
jgi:hypothetical protein